MTPCPRCGRTSAAHDPSIHDSERLAAASVALTRGQRRFMLVGFAGGSLFGFCAGVGAALIASLLGA